MADRTVRVRLSAQVQEYISGMEQAAKATRETGTETEKLAQQSQAFEQMGRAAMLAGGGIVAGLTIATKAAIDWDTAWAGVTKTVDGTPEQMAALEQGLRDLTGVLPASHAEIAAVAEAAGQLGIQTPNVIEFTRTMIDLGETTNLTAEDAATSLARFMNVMGTSQTQVSNLGSALVELGNNYATTEREILEMSMRLAGAGKQIGMTEGEVMGLSTALSSVGIEAEAGGSAMSKVMIDIAASVEEGGERLEMFANVAGVSADEFSRKWRSDPGAALALFVQGLADAEAQGTSTLGVLAELGITEVRMRDALLRSASASDLFTEAMQQGNSALEANTALGAEAEKRYETTAAKLQVMGNKVVDAAISIGEHLLPAVEAAAGGIGSFADAIGGMEGPLSGFVAWGGLVLGTGLLGVGVWMTAIPKIAQYRAALETLNLAGGRLDRTLGALGKAGLIAGAAFAAATATQAGFEASMRSGVKTNEELTNALLTSKDSVELLMAAGDRSQWSEFWHGDGYTDTLEDLGGLLDRTAGKANNFWSHAFFGTTNKDIAALDSLERMGEALAGLASTDLPAASRAFGELAREQDLTDAELVELIGRMGPFRDALVEQATAMGIAASDTNLLKIATGELKPATDQATDATDDNVESLEELQGVATETTEAVENLADEIRNFGSAQMDSEEAAIKFHEELEELNALVNEGATGLDLNTEAGRNNRQALLDMAQATNESAAATFAATGDQEALNARLEQGRTALYNAAIQFGMTEGEARAYADQLIATPASVQTHVELTGVSAAEQALANLTRVRYVGVNVMYNEQSAPWHAPMKTPGTANGGLHEFADGGFTTGIYTGGTPIHKFAEPETIWEAYISGKPDQRERNRQIWVETGERLGMNVGGQQVTPVVYVQNPFTGKYLLAKVDQVANNAIDESIQQQARENRKGF